MTAAAEHSDVVVIGGGLSGLCSALRLLEGSNGDVSVRVLEARDRVGGRTWTDSVRIGENTVTFDRGGQWVGPHQQHVLALMSRFDMATSLQFARGKRVLEYGGSWSTYSSDIPTCVNPIALLDLHLLMSRVTRDASTVPASAPWTSVYARDFDSMTCKEYLRRFTWTNGCRQLVEATIKGVFAVEADDVSVLQFLAYVSSSQGIENLVTCENGNQHMVCTEGSQAISKHLAQVINQHSNGCVLLDHAVCRVEQDEHKSHPVRVVTRNGLVFRCKRVIVACPPVVASKVVFEPRLPPRKEQVMQRQFMGHIIKISIFYPTPFWREMGYSGEVVSDCANGPCFQVFDGSKTREDGSLLGCLVVFINAERARQETLNSADARRDAVLTHLKSFFGDATMRPDEWVETDWGRDEWSRGCPVGVFSPGLLFRAGEELRRPCGRIHWGATELARHSQGFMDGAVESGYRVADEVLECMDQSHPAHDTKPACPPSQRDYDTLHVPLPYLWLALALCCVVFSSWAVKLCM